MKDPKEFIVFGQPKLGKAEIDEVNDSLKSGWLGTGPKVHQFEHDFSVYKDAKYVAAVNSCTAALHLSLLASGVGPGDEVITTAMTFCATVNAIIHTGATPILVDIEPDTMNINPSLIEEKITTRTQAIVPVHFAGLPCNMDAILKIAKKYKLEIIEDCAHAVEATYRGKPVGTIGAFGCFSFYATKNVVTGEGGMILAKKKKDIDKIKILALHGMNQDAWHRFGDEGHKHYLVTECGFKYNMMDIQAAMGIHQLKKVEENLKIRNLKWEQYQEAFQGLDLILPTEPDVYMKHGRHLYCIRLKTGSSKKRDQVLNRLTEKKIGVGVHYMSIPEHPFYQKKFGWHPAEFPVSKRVGRTSISLPLSPHLSNEQQNYIIQTIRELV